MKKFQLICAAVAFLGLQSLYAQEDKKSVTVELGKEAPDFTLKGEKNQTVSLSDYKGTNVVLIFSKGHSSLYCTQQLVQLRKQKVIFKRMGIQIVVVFREEAKGASGALKSAIKSGISPILLDTPADKTKTYSMKGYSTYFIGKDGKVKAELSASRGVRPTAKVILAKAREVFK